jgi:hypothetical protein
MVPEAELDEAKDLLAEVPSTARPILPRVIAIIVLVVFVGPLIATALNWLAGLR